jgi:hypothetical protein
MNEVFEWVGTFCGITGAGLIASNVRLSPWGWWLFLASSLSLCGYGVSVGAYGILLLNLCFVATNLLGLIRVWLPYIRDHRAKPHTISSSDPVVATTQA